MRKGKRRTFINGFGRQEFADITGLSRYMVDYLARQGYLAPTYRVRGRDQFSASQGQLPEGRGITRFYSFRDLVIGRMIKHLCDSGIELRRLRKSLAELQGHPSWAGAEARQPEGLLKWAVFDGKGLMLRNAQDDHLDPLGGMGQRAFGFLVDVDEVSKFVVSQLKSDSAAAFTMSIEPLVERRQAS
jgi:DNA-binding transcriptional MerR regulator